MSSKLNYVKDWQRLVRQANWSASLLAKATGVSVRALERHFVENFGRSPKAWLMEQRRLLAIDLLQKGCSVKEAAHLLGYSHPQHFSRDFRHYWGFSPSALTTSARASADTGRILV
ncbi:MAG TPA: helix-turn-helix transcriptional regulator [Verrucomicrobiae bacterium]|jgi:AraC-like DNA-binding protein|nr:helix-turn-helix transcriptional regulator [Verrucomicrobiae bacterium]